MIGGFWLDVCCWARGFRRHGRRVHRTRRRRGRVRRRDADLPEAGVGGTPGGGAAGDQPTLIEAIREGAVLRVRPKAMTVTVILAGLLPIMWSHGTGSEVMQRIAAPMIGGMVRRLCFRCS